MEKLKKLTLSFTLMSVLALSAFAGETASPPYDPGQTSTPPCVPGETAAPPCASQSVNYDSTDPGQSETPPTSGTLDITNIAEAVVWSLLLF